MSVCGSLLRGGATGLVSVHGISGRAGTFLILSVYSARWPRDACLMVSKTKLTVMVAQTQGRSACEEQS